MPLGATILNFEPLHPDNIGDTLDFSVPMDDGIRIISSVSLLSFASKYYGDLINIQFWRLLGMRFGVTPSPSNPLTLQPGYKYVYNHGTRVFDVYDNNGTNIVHTTNIQYIVDLNIDFTIHKSHQFEIIIDPSAFGARFFIPAKLVKDAKEFLVPDIIRCGVDNIYPLDMKKEPIITREMYLFGDSKGDGFSEFDTDGRIKKWYLDALHYFWDIDWDKNCPMNCFYLSNRFNVFSSNKLLQIFRSKQFNIDLLLSMLSQNLYPNVMPVQRSGETQNNRPVYEPWLIWGFYNFLYNHRTVDEDDTFVIPVFDLSPQST